jgi:hypothetical protein
MSTGDTTAVNSRAAAFSSDFSTSALVIKAGATTLATHTLAGFGAPLVGVITASAIADVTIAATETADSATVTDTAGEYTLTVGTTGSGADVILSTLAFIAGETSSVSALTVTFPA